MISAMPDSGLRVLVIDDQASMRAIVGDLLHQIGIRDVIEAEDGEVALKVLADPTKNFPDLVICDLHMERMDGIQFCNAVRRNETYRDRGVPIIILTGDHDPMVHDVARQVGAVSVATKPITAQELKSLVEKKVGFVLAA